MNYSDNYENMPNRKQKSPIDTAIIIMVIINIILFIVGGFVTGYFTEGWSDDKGSGNETVTVTE